MASLMTQCETLTCMRCGVAVSGSQVSETTAWPCARKQNKC